MESENNIVSIFERHGSIDELFLSVDARLPVPERSGFIPVQQNDSQYSVYADRKNQTD